MLILANLSDIEHIEAGYCQGEYNIVQNWQFETFSVKRHRRTGILTLQFRYTRLHTRNSWPTCSIPFVIYWFYFFFLVLLTYSFGNNTLACLFGVSYRLDGQTCVKLYNLSRTSNTIRQDIRMHRWGLVTVKNFKEICRHYMGC